MKWLLELRSARRLALPMLIGIAGGGLSSAEAQWVQVNDELKVMNETFTGTTLSSGWQVGGSNYTPSLTAATNLDSAGSGWLRLTSAGTQQATYAYNSESFAAENATIAAKFKYAAYGGNGADGITFFLADASKTFGVGAYGGSLGYAQKTLAGGGEANLAGMNGGYIGLGIDEFGNYSNPTEGRIGGPGSQPGNISIRGPGDGYTGYEYLGGTGQLTTPIAFAGSTRPSGLDERTFQVVITATNQLTVYMQAGDSAPMQALYSIDLSGYARPEDLVLGFTGSTGGQTNIHEIQGLMLTSQVARLWDNTSGDSTWSGSTNWDGTNGKTPAVGADILLDNHYVGSAQTINVGPGATRSIRSLQIDAPFAYTLNNGTLVFDDQGVLGPSGVFVSQGNGAANHTIGSAITLGNAIDISNSSSGALTLSGPLSTNGHAVTLAGAGNTLLSGSISGAGSIQKLGSGTVTLSGNSTYSGGTTLTAGTLAVGHNNALGSGAVTINAGTVTSIATTPNTIGNDIVLQGNAALTNINTSGTLTQTGANRTLTLSNVTHSGTVNLSNDATGRTLTVGVDAGTSTISGVIQNGASGNAGPGSLTKTGTGTLTLSGANTYTGTTAINAGTVRLGADNRLADSSSVSIGSLGTLDLAGRSEKIGNLTAAGGATLNFGTSSGLNTFVFGNYTAPASGVLVVSNWERNGAFEDVLATTVGGQNVNTIYFSGFGVGQIAGLRTDNIYGTTANGAFLITPVATAHKEWDGTSNATWSTADNWTERNAPTSSQIALFDRLGLGRRTVNLDAFSNASVAGIRFGAGATEGYTIQGSWATLTLNGTVPFIQLQSAAEQRIAVTTLALARSTVADITGTGNLTISSAISGNGAALIRDGKGTGRLVLSGANTFTGGLYINNGIVQANNDAALGSGAATLSDGTTLVITGGRTIANAISLIGTGVDGAGALRGESGTNTLSGTITETGDTTIAADAGATLTLSGNLTGNNFTTTLGGAGNITLGSTDAGAITTGTGGIIINGTGTVTFRGGSAANTYTGTTEVRSGTLVLNKTAGTTAVAGNLTIGDNLGNPSTSTVQLGQSNQIKDTSRVTINADGRLDLNGRVETIGSLAGNGQIDNASVTASTLTVGDTSISTFDGRIAGNLGLIKTGTGKLTLKGDNTYTGGTNVQKGIVAIQSNTALGTGALTVTSGANLELAGGITVSNAMTLNGPGTLANDGAVQSTAGQNTLTGDIRLGNASRIMADSGSTLTLSGANAITSSGGSAQNIIFGGSGDIIVNKVIGSTTSATNVGTVTKEGGGTLTLAGTAANTFSGATFVDAGTLVLAKSTNTTAIAGALVIGDGSGSANSAVVRLDSAGQISDASAVTLNADGQLNLNGRAETIGSLAGSGVVDNAASTSTTLTVGNGSNTTYSGTIQDSGSGSLALSKQGTGTLTLSGANTYAGGTALAGGVLAIQNSSALGTGAIAVSSGANLELSGGLTVANAVTLNGTGIGSTGDGSLQSTSGANRITGAVTLGSTTRITADAGSSLALAGPIAAAGRALTIAGAGDTEISGGFSSAAGVVSQSGTGTLHIGGIDGSNAFAASRLDLNTGTVKLEAGNILNTAINFNGGTFAVNGFDETVSSATLSANSVLDFNSLGGVFNFTTGLYSAGALTINGWVGSVAGGGASQLFASSAIAASFLDQITFAGYDPGAQLLDTGEIVPNTGSSIYRWNVDSSGEWSTRNNWNPRAPTGGPNGTDIAVVFGNVISDGRTVTLTAGRTVGYMTFNSTERYTVTGSAVTLRVNNEAAQINLSNSGGATIESNLTLSDALQINQNSTGEFLVSGNMGGSGMDITVAGAGTTRISGNIATGSGELNKNSAGTLVLSGANTFTGATEITGGTLEIRSAGALGTSAGGTTVGAGATLALSGNITSAENSITLNGTGVYSAGALRNLSGTNTLSGGIALATSSAIGVDSGSLTLSGNVSGAGELTKVGAGTLVFSGSGANTYTGATTISAGMLELQKGGGLGATGGGTTVASGATLALSGGITSAESTITLHGAGIDSAGALRNLSGANILSGNVVLGGGTRIGVDAESLTLSGTVSGSSLSKVGAGTLVLNGTNTYTGGTVITNGIVRINGDRSLGAVPTGSDADNITLNGGTLTTSQSMTLNSNRGITLGTDGGTLEVADASTLNFSSTITGPGELTLALGGKGVFNLTADLTFSGTLNLSGGTLRLTDATFAVGVFHITGNTILDFAGSSSTLDITHLIIDDGVNVTVTNWQNGSDFLLAQTWQGATINTRGEGDETKVIFDPGVPGPPDVGNSDDTAWLPYDGSTGQITPVPEPSTYGAIFLGLCTAAVGWRRWRSQAQPQR